MVFIEAWFVMFVLHGTHHPCGAWGHSSLATRITGIKPQTLEDVRDDGTMPPNAEETLDRAGYVRIHTNDRDDRLSVSWNARIYDPKAKLTEAQRSWLVINGYKRRILDIAPVI